MSKETQRQFYRQLRSNIPADLARFHSEQIADQLKIILREGFAESTLYLYKGLRGEPDLLPYLSDLRSHMALPKVQLGSHMTFHLWAPGDPLVETALGILEPPSDALELLPGPGDVAIVPAIAIDRKGRRLGFGGGYYDRWLSRHRHHLKLIVGAVFPECFCQDLSGVEPHDIAVDLCITGEQSVNFFDTP